MKKIVFAYILLSLSFLNLFSSNQETTNISSQNRLNQALLNAASHGNLKQVKLALENGANVNATDSTGFTPLIHALMGGRIREYWEIIKLLLENYKADVNIKSDSGLTALMVTVGNTYKWTTNTILLINALLKAGANINAEDSNGQTALDIAFKYNYPQVVDFLKSKLK